MANLQFEVSEFEYRHKGTRWYLVFSAVVIALLIFAWLSRNYLFAGFVVVATATLIWMNSRKPRKLMLLIDNEGIAIEKTQWHYKDLQGFSLHKEGDNGAAYLTLVPKSRFLLPVRIVAPDSEAIREELNNFLTEVEYEESTIEAIVRLLGL